MSQIKKKQKSGKRQNRRQNTYQEYKNDIKLDEVNDKTKGKTIAISLRCSVQVKHIQCECEQQIRKADSQIVEHHKVLNRVSGMITTWDEVTTLGIWLHCDPNDVERLQSENNSVKGAAFKILRSFYKRISSSQEKVQMLTNALTELGKQTAIGDINSLTCGNELPY